MTNINSEDFRKNYPPNAVPDTQKLQQNILAATEGLEQQIEKGTQPSRAGTEAQSRARPMLGFFNFLGQPLVVGMAASVAIIAIAFSVWSPNFNARQDTVIVNVSPEASPSGSLSLSELSIDELEFQELMLFDDELMFAQL